MMTVKIKKWMKQVVAMACVVALGLAAVGCSSQKAEAPKESQGTQAASSDYLQKIKDKGVLVMGTSADYPPYEFHKTIDGKDTIVGFDIDIAKGIAADLGVKLEIVDMKFEGLLPALVGGKVDMIVAGMNPTEERKKSVDFSMIYYEANQTMLVKADAASNLGTKESFKGKVIGVQKGTLQEQIAADQFKESQVKALGKIPDLVMELKTGKIDGIILADVVAKSYDASNADIAVNGLDLGSEGGCSVALPKGNEAYTKAVDESLKKMMDSGKVDEWITQANLLVE